MWFDTHTHLADEAFDIDREQLVGQFSEEEIGYIIDAGTNFEDSRKAINNAKKFKEVFAAVGIHPDFIGDLKQGYLEELKNLALSDPKVVAIGEVGLDYHYDIDPREYQKKCLIEMMELAIEVDKPVIIHDRDAHGDTLEIIKNVGGRGVLHSFSGSLEMAAECIKEGFYISISGVITFKNEKKLKEMLPYLPKDKILVETDSPCLAPVPFRGKRNQPAYVKYPGEMVAQVLGISIDECKKMTTQNAKKLFDIS